MASSRFHINLADSGPETQPIREEPRAARSWGHRDTAATGRGRGPQRATRRPLTQAAAGPQAEWHNGAGKHCG